MTTDAPLGIKSWPISILVSFESLDADDDVSDADLETEIVGGGSLPAFAN